MREDLRQREDENFIEWIERLHKIVVDVGYIEKADREVLALLVNNIPQLTNSITHLAESLRKVNEAQAEHGAALDRLCDQLGFEK